LHCGRDDASLFYFSSSCGKMEIQCACWCCVRVSDAVRPFPCRRNKGLTPSDPVFTSRPQITYKFSSSQKLTSKVSSGSDSRGCNCKAIHISLSPWLKQGFAAVSVRLSGRNLPYCDTCTSVPVPSSPFTGTVNLTLRRLMSYIYGAPILDVSRSHTTTQHSR